MRTRQNGNELKSHWPSSCASRWLRPRVIGVIDKMGNPQSHMAAVGQDHYSVFTIPIKAWDWSIEKQELYHEAMTEQDRSAVMNHLHRNGYVTEVHNDYNQQTV